LSAALLSGTLGFACGDKLLNVSRGLRFQRAYAGRQANLVIYSSATSNGVALKSARLLTTLRQAGHNLQTVEDLSQLDRALKSGKVDVVLADFSEVTGISRELQAAPSKPVIVPVLDKASKNELAAAQREYKFTVKASADAIQYLTAIDGAMKFRLKTPAKS
jgi:ABC-type amino acid transport substrate-binding protein